MKTKARPMEGATEPTAEELVDTMLSATPEGRARALIKALPGSIRIGHLDIAIVLMDHREANRNKAFGEMRYNEFAIAIDETIRSPYKTVDTFLHEIAHVLWTVFHLEDGDKEERIIAPMGTGWTMVYRDNPWLIDWIKQGMRE